MTDPEPWMCLDLLCPTPMAYSMFLIAAKFGHTVHAVFGQPGPHRVLQVQEAAPVHNHKLGLGRVVSLGQEGRPSVDHLVEDHSHTPPIAELGVSWKGGTD